MLTSFWKCDKKTKFASYAIKFASHAKKYMKYGYFFMKKWYFLRKKLKITKYCVSRKKRRIKLHILVVLSDKKILRFFKKRHNFRREKTFLSFLSWMDLSSWTSDHLSKIQLRFLPCGQPPLFVYSI